MIGEGTTRRQLEPEPDQTPSQHTDYSANATNRTARTTTRQRTLSLDRTEYSQNTNYSHILRRDTNDPELTTATEPRTKPQTPRRVGVPRAPTARSTAPKTRTTAAHLTRRRHATTTGTTPRGWNHKRSHWSRKQRSQARQRTTHTKHHCPCQVEHPAPRWKPTPNHPPLPKPLSHPWNHCPVASTSPQTTTPWT